MNIWMQRWRALNTAPAFSSKAWLLWAARFTFLFFVLHIAGLREDTTVLSGTVVGKSAMVSGFLGLMYLLSYFGALLLAPPALFAAAVTAVAEYLWRRKHSS